jgi:hypothetical protein
LFLKGTKTRKPSDPRSRPDFYCQQYADSFPVIEPPDITSNDRHSINVDNIPIGRCTQQTAKDSILERKRPADTVHVQEEIPNSVFTIISDINRRLAYPDINNVRQRSDQLQAIQFLLTSSNQRQYLSTIDPIQALLDCMTASSNSMVNEANRDNHYDHLWQLDQVHNSRSEILQPRESGVGAHIWNQQWFSGTSDIITTIPESTTSSVVNTQLARAPASLQHYSKPETNMNLQQLLLLQLVNPSLNQSTSTMGLSHSDFLANLFR